VNAAVVAALTAEMNADVVAEWNVQVSAGVNRSGGRQAMDAAACELL
jgi:hypothetical protein